MFRIETSLALQDTMVSLKAGQASAQAQGNCGPVQRRCLWLMCGPKLEKLETDSVLSHLTTNQQDMTLFTEIAVYSNFKEINLHETKQVVCRDPPIKRFVILPQCAQRCPRYSTTRLKTGGSNKAAAPGAFANNTATRHISTGGAAQHKPVEAELPVHHLCGAPTDPTMESYA